MRRAVALSPEIPAVPDQPGRGDRRTRQRYEESLEVLEAPRELEAAHGCAAD